MPKERRMNEVEEQLVGQRPVNMLACEGRVQGAVARAPSKRIPCFASRSRVGVVTRP